MEESMTLSLAPVLLALSATKSNPSSKLAPTEALSRMASTRAGNLPLRAIPYLASLLGQGFIERVKEGTHWLSKRQNRLGRGGRKLTCLNPNPKPLPTPSMSLNPSRRA